MILVTHLVDLDGLGPIVIAKYLKLNISHVIMMAYGEEKSEDGEFKTKQYEDQDSIIVTDFAISPELYEYIKTHFKSYRIFDHHERTQELIEDPYVYFDLQRCGTKLFYDYVKENYIEKNNLSISPLLEKFVNITDTFDLWKKTDPLWDDCQKLNHVLWYSMNFEYENDDWRRYKTYVDLQLDKLYSGEKEFYFTPYENQLIQRGIEQEEEAYEDALKNMQIRTDSKNKKFIIYQGRRKISVICSKLLDKYPEASYVLCCSTYQPMGVPDSMNGKISARSREDFNVRDLFSIDGHHSAGSGKFDLDYLLDIWNGKINNIPYINSR